MKLKRVLSVCKKFFIIYCLFWLLNHIFIYQFWCDDNTININLQWNQMLSLSYISYITTILFCWSNLHNSWIFLMLILWNIINIINFNFSINDDDNNKEKCLYKVLYYEEIVWSSIMIIILLINYINERNKYSHIQFAPMIHKNAEEAAMADNNNNNINQQQQQQMITLDLDHDSTNSTNSYKEPNDDLLIDEEDVI